MNIKLLKQVCDKIEEEPNQFEMGSWFTRYVRCKDEKEITIPNCGTAACIAGWAISIATSTNPAECNLHKNPPAVLLDLTPTQASRLFYTIGWPLQFQTVKGVGFYSLTKKQQAALAVKRINHFIETNGDE